MDAFFISSRRAATENSPQFQLRVEWKRTSQVPQGRKNHARIFSVAPAGLGFFVRLTHG
jgi:hypothetical protein